MLDVLTAHNLWGIFGTIPEGSGFIFESEIISFREGRWYDALLVQKVMLVVLLGTCCLQPLGYLWSEN